MYNGNLWPLSIYPDSGAAKHIAGVDWVETTLGDITTWSCALRTAVGFILNSSFPMLAWVGRDNIQIANDAFARLSGYPTIEDNNSVIGKLGADSFAINWSTIADKIDEVRRTGKPLYTAQDSFQLSQRDLSRQLSCTSTYDPIRDEQGNIIGVVCLLVEKDAPQDFSKKKDKDYLFLADLGAKMDALREESVESAAMRSLGDYFDADRIGLAELIADSSRVSIVHCHQNEEVKDIKGEHDLNDYMQSHHAFLAAGNIFIENNTATSQALSEEQQTMFRRIDVGSILNIPLLNNGELKAVFFVHFRMCRQWHDEEVQLLRMCASKFWDVLNSVRARHEMARSEQYYRSLVNSFDQAFMVIDFQFDENNRPVDYTFVHVNPAFEAQTGLKAVVGKTIKQIMPDVEPSWLENYGKVALSGVAIRFEEYNAATAGWYDVYAAPLGGHTGQVVVVFSDVTLRKLEDDRKKDFLSMASHELKTPLTSLKAYLDIAARKVKKNDVNSINIMLEKANGQLQRMTTIINGFLNLNELEKGRLKLDMRLFDLVGMLREIKTDAQLTNSNYTFDFPDDTSIFIYSDEDKLRQVIINLINNAVKYSPVGSSVALRCSRKDHAVRITVSDQGIGINEQHHPQIFERFYRVSDSWEKGLSGFGIGLYIAKEITAALGGEIGLESSINEGSTFWVELPQKNV